MKVSDVECDSDDGCCLLKVMMMLIMVIIAVLEREMFVFKKIVELVVIEMTQGISDGDDDERDGNVG